MLKWYYSLYKLKVNYVMDEKAFIATIVINKPLAQLIEDEAEQVRALMEHFAGRGYHVIIKD